MCQRFWGDYAIGPVCPVLSLCDVGVLWRQTVEWIKMKLGIEV